jgi:hypothetical protein
LLKEDSIEFPFVEVKLDKSDLLVGSGAEFWTNYYGLYNFLMENYPNKKSLVDVEDRGPLDGVHLEFLIQKYPQITQLK